MFIKLRENKAFTLVEIMIVVAIIGLLIAIALPNFMRARGTTRLNLCKNNLRLLGHGAEQYRIDNNLDDTTVVSLANASLYMKSAPVCPAAGTYTLPTADTVHCSATGHGTFTISTGGWVAT